MQTMTRYLSGTPFSNGVSNGKMTDLEYQVAVGALQQCPACGKYFPPDEHACMGCGRNDCGFVDCGCPK